MANIIFVINGKYYVFDTVTNTWDDAEKADTGTELRIVDKVLNGELPKKDRVA